MYVCVCVCARVCVLSSTVIFCCHAVMLISISLAAKYQISAVHLNVKCYGWEPTPFITPSPSEYAAIQHTHTHTLTHTCTHLLTLPDMRVYQPSLSGETHLP